jgi:predicted CoA-binding protein
MNSRLELYQRPEVIERLLRNSRTIALVGLSRNPDKDSHVVAVYLQRAGYRIVPVHPAGGEILGEKVYPDLVSIPFPIDLVDLFRPAREAGFWVDQTIERTMRGHDSPALWFQLGIIDFDAGESAAAAGLAVVMDKCTMVEHRRLLAS